MTAEERQRMIDLCGRIAVEKDSQQFDALISNLSALLGDKSTRSDANPPPSPAPEN